MDNLNKSIEDTLDELKDIDLKRRLQDQTQQIPYSVPRVGTCLNCGYCPHCGRSTQPYPYTIIWGSTSGGSGTSNG